MSSFHVNVPETVEWLSSECAREIGGQFRGSHKKGWTWSGGRLSHWNDCVFVHPSLALCYFTRKTGLLSFQQVCHSSQVGAPVFCTEITWVDWKKLSNNVKYLIMWLFFKKKQKTFSWWKHVPRCDGRAAPKTDSASDSAPCQRSRRWSNLWGQKVLH